MYICCLKYTSDLKTQIENKNWTEKMFHANGNKKKAGVILISDKADFKKQDCCKRQRRTSHINN